MKIKKSIIALVVISMLLLCFPVNAATLQKPEFKAADAHIANVLSMFEPTKDGDILFATILNNKAVERLTYLTTSVYNYQDKYTDAIFMYDVKNMSSIEVNHYSLKNNTLSFSLSSPLIYNEKLAVILDDGESVRFEKLTLKNYYSNKYWVYDVYASQCINVKVVAYTEETEGYYTSRYGMLLGEAYVPCEIPSPYNMILSFTLPNQIGDTIIDNSGHIIYIVLAPGTNAAALAPTITCSPKAQVIPATLTTNNFTKDAIYTVIAEDFSTIQYTVKVITANNTTVGPVYYPAPILPYYPPYHSPFYPPYSPPYYPPIYPPVY